MSELLSARHVNAGYGKKEVLHDISFALRQNKLTALIGTNGCGKSTLLRACCGLIGYSGCISISGNVVSRLTPNARAKRMALIGQQSDFTLSMSVRDAVLLGLYPELGLSKRITEEMRKQADDILRKVGIFDLAEQDVQTLSGGQKQLVQWARTLIRPTDILFLDEPDSALDIVNRSKIMRLLKSTVLEKNMTCLMSTHDINLSMMFADRLLLMKNGRITNDIILREADPSTLRAALTDIFGDITLYEDNGRYLVTGKIK